MEILEQFRNLISVENKFIKGWKHQNKPVLGYACSYTPEEIIYAGEILPIRVLGSLEPNSCDNQNKIYDLWRHCTAIHKTYFINTPHSSTENAIKFFYEELERFKEWLTKEFDVEISEENLKDAIGIFNENRRLLKSVYELRKRSPPLVSKSREDLPRKGVRLLVSGSVMGNSELFRLIESVGGCVVADDLCTGSRYFWNLVSENGDSTMAIAERYLCKIPCPFMYSSEERFKHVREMVKLFDVEGVLIFCLKSCDVHSFDAPPLAEELRENEGLPVSCLEWEHSLSGIGQLKTRIEAFIEMLEE